MIRDSSREVVHEAGLPASGGSFTCLECSLTLTLEAGEDLPECPGCGSTSFKRSSMFEREEGQPTLTDMPLVEPTEPDPGWLDAVRDSIEQPGKYLAYFVDGRARVRSLAEGWSRIGRSGSADIRIDDPTVSRRHAVVVLTAEGELRVLDDRSLNGILVNGDRVDWSPLRDGDELQVGRYTLYVVETPGARPDPSMS